MLPGPLDLSTIMLIQGRTNMDQIWIRSPCRNLEYPDDIRVKGTWSQDPQSSHAGKILLVPFGYYITPSVQRAEVRNVAPSERRYSHCLDADGGVRDGRKYCRKELVVRRRQVTAAHRRGDEKLFMRAGSY